MPGSVKVGGAYKTITSASCKVNGTWKKITDGWAKDAGMWKKIYSTAPPPRPPSPGFPEMPPNGPGPSFVLGAYRPSAQTTGTYSVYANNGDGWQSDVVSAYDVPKAIQASKMWGRYGTLVDKEDRDGYYNWRVYGNIIDFMDKEEGRFEQHWYAYSSDNSGNLTPLEDNLGSYRCFSDYDWEGTHRIANIVLYYGSDSTTTADVQNSFNGYADKVPFSQITTVDKSDKYKVEFFVKNNMSDSTATVVGEMYGLLYDDVFEEEFEIEITDSNLKYYEIKLTGFGSDCYTALKDAVKEDNIFAQWQVPDDNEYPKSPYGRLSGIFDLNLVKDEPTYRYWATTYNGGEWGEICNSVKLQYVRL